MRRYSYIFLIFSVIVIFGCTKDEITPTPPGNDPVFSVIGSIDGLSIDIVAGEQNNFMYTDVVEVNGVDRYKGAISNGTDKFQLSIYDGMLDIPEINTDIMGVGSIDLAPFDNNDILATLSKEMFPNSSYIESLEWTINGEKQPNSTVYIKQPGNYEVCVDMTFENGTLGSTCNKFLIGFQNNVTPKLNYLVNEANDIIAFAHSANSNVSSIKWYRNDVLVSESLTYVDSASNLDRYVLKARMIFKNGGVSEREIWINRNSKNYRIVDFSYIENETELNWDNKATIEIDLNGEKYISNPSEEDHLIKIKDSWEYGTNAEGDQVTFLKGIIESTFTKVSSGEVVKGNFNVSFGVAH